MPKTQKNKALEDIKVGQEEIGIVAGVKRPANDSGSIENQTSIAKKPASEPVTKEESEKSWVYVVIHTTFESRSSEGSDGVVSIHKSAASANKTARKFFRDKVLPEYNKQDADESNVGGLYHANVVNENPRYQECSEESVEVSMIELED
jgi:hypothetical protein